MKNASITELNLNEVNEVAGAKAICIAGCWSLSLAGHSTEEVQACMRACAESNTHWAL